MNKNMIVTKEWLEEKHACSSGMEWFNAQKRKSVESVAKALVKEGHANWANWLVTRKLPDKISCVKYALFAARLVLDIFEKRYPNDNRVRKCIEVTERYVDGKATIEEIRTAKSADAAYAAAVAAADAAADAAAAYAAAVAAAAYAAADAAAADAADAAAAYAADAAAYAARNGLLLKAVKFGLTLLGGEK